MKLRNLSVLILGTLVLFLGTAQASEKHPWWMLHYRCDAQYCRDDEGNAIHWKAFRTKQEAIDWMGTNYQYYPLDIQHGKFNYSCEYEYLFPDDPDPITSKRKEVTCSVKKENNPYKYTIRNDWWEF